MAKSQSYKDIAYNYLKEQIDNNILLPDTHLKEVDIANQLGMSRTPVRRAMHELEEEGYIRTEPYKGAVVAKSVLNSRALIDRLQVIEILIMTLLQQMQNKEVTVDPEPARKNYQAMKEAMDNNDAEAYYKAEFDNFAELVSYHPNSYFRQITLNTISTLHELYLQDLREDANHWAEAQRELVNIYPDLIDNILNKDYQNARKKVRIWLNQLILMQINR
ncbi:GntR family transcriptional regulator [Aerococcus urinaehominis]|uniref:GntR family transcriptional regulator n=1 Tax=Aerococcus urinaehominis TaxID=128944 RepID=A0A0X8FLC7_9LACT|nr:GntR family transcriptional regulator [Aerococcus urinaehominis]AMB99453.1 GntR family transcriptional regulator [Aerococcus urinaehominis]SDM28423.1 DNA-binding transcriptional regulator, GntR family [Aerococcus urinaehominis]